MKPESDDAGARHAFSGPDIIITRGERRVVIGLLILVLIMGAAALLSSYFEWHDYEAAQRQQSMELELKLCTTLDQLANLKAPTGSATANPSRGYEQRQQEILAQLKTDLGCR